MEKERVEGAARRALDALKIGRQANQECLEHSETNDCAAIEQMANLAIKTLAEALEPGAGES